MKRVFSIYLCILLVPFGLAAQLHINEFVAANDSTTGYSDPNGQYDDWIEIYNSSDQAIDLSGYHLSDDFANASLWAFPNGTTIEADGYLIVWADNDTTQNGLHAYFKLSRLGEELILTDNEENPLDALSYDEQIRGKSSARIPNGTGNFVIGDVTPNVNNESSIGELVSANSVVINEIMASNSLSSGISDAAGEYDDWIELYNKNSVPVDLGGYFLSDDPEHKRKWAFPYGTMIPADGYLIVWCDNDQEQDDLHTNFNLNAAGETLMLSYGNGAVIDEVTFGQQTPNISYARIPNGGTIFIQTQPTFNAPNSVPDDVEVNFQDLTINEFVASNDSTSTIVDEMGENEDWIEIYNNTDFPISLENFFLSDSIGYPQQWAFPDMMIGARDYIVVWADGELDEGVLHANFNLNRLGEELILSYNSMVIDSVSFGEQQTNMAAARRPNGTGPFQIQETTFMAHNDPNYTDLSEIPTLEFQVYPNPAKEKIALDLQRFNHLSDTEVYIYDNKGQLVYQQNFVLTNPTLTLDVSSFNKGIYFLEVYNQEMKATTKLVVTD